MTATDRSVVPGSRNSITDVPGIRVGNAEDRVVRSGVTVVLPDRAGVAAVDIRGGGSGSRETALLDPAAMVQQVDAIVLSGGSAFGLDAAGGVMSWLAARGRGFSVGLGGLPAIVPIVPQAILFDLLNGGDKRAFRDPTGAALPYRNLAKRACDTAGLEVALGNAGAGYGAASGDLKGGLGSASAILPDGVTVGALAAVNSFGPATMPDGTFWAWQSERDGEYGGRPPPSQHFDPLAGAFRRDATVGPVSGANTTLAIVATDLVLTRPDAQRIATMAQDGFSRALYPVHTPYDGDTVFVLSTGARLPLDPVGDIARVGAVAADCVARAIARGVFEAATLGACVGWQERFG
jgi:L-aminopeptidase/D-esterase-like protein